MTSPAAGGSGAPAAPAAPAAPSTTTPAGGDTGGAPTQVVDAAPTPASPATVPPQTVPVPGAPAPSATPQPPKAGQVDLSTLDPAVQKYIGDLRDQAASVRTSPKDLEKAQKAAADSAAETERVKGVLDAIGLALNPDGTKDALTPEKLQQQISEGATRETTLTADNRDLAMRLDAWRIAAAIGANALELDDSIGFRDEVKKLDPAGGDYKAELAALIAKTADSNPQRFKLTPASATAAATQTAPGQVPGSAPSGGDFAGGSGTSEPDMDALRASFRRQRDER